MFCARTCWRRPAPSMARWRPSSVLSKSCIQEGWFGRPSLDSVAPSLGAIHVDRLTRRVLEVRPARLAGLIDQQRRLARALGIAADRAAPAGQPAHLGGQ